MKQRIFENGVDCAHFSRSLPSRQTCYDVVRCTSCGEAKPIIDFEYCSEFNARQRNSVSVHSTDCKVCRIARLSGLKASGLWDKNIEAYWVSRANKKMYGDKIADEWRDMGCP